MNKESGPQFSERVPLSPESLRADIARMNRRFKEGVPLTSKERHHDIPPADTHLARWILQAADMSGKGSLGEEDLRVMRDVLAGMRSADPGAYQQLLETADNIDRLSV